MIMSYVRYSELFDVINLQIKCVICDHTSIETSPVVGQYWGNIIL